MAINKLYTKNKNSAIENSNSYEQSWEAVLKDAQVQLSQAQGRVKDLRMAIHQIETRIKSGERSPIGSTHI